MGGATVRVVAAGTDDRPMIEALMREYLRELSAFRADPAPGPNAYPYLDLYWAEPDRRAFLIKAAGKVAGFALVNAWAPSGLWVDRCMAEFYVAAACRRAGVGTGAALDVLRSLPGMWEIGTLAGHDAARAFWDRVIRRIPGASPTWLEGDGARWAGPILRVRSTGPAT